MKNVIVIFGGVSCEHDISIITGLMVLNSIDKKLYKPIPIYVDKNGTMLTGENFNNVDYVSKGDYKKAKKVFFLTGDSNLYTLLKNGKTVKGDNIDVAINCLHGLNGEDGSLCGVMQLSNIPLASPNAFASSCCIDKAVTKIVLGGLNVNILPYVKLNKRNYFNKKDLALKYVEKKIEYPLIVKPANLGSSIGINYVKDRETLISAIEKAFVYDSKIIVEQALTDFIEINCACYKCQDNYCVSECEEPFTKNEILTFEDKYLNNGLSGKNFPAKIEKVLSDKIRETTKYLYRKLEMQGIIRVDYLIANNVIYVNEINTVPGSLAYYLFCDNLLEFKDLLSKIMEESIKNFRDFKSNKFLFNTETLKVGVKGAIKK